MRAALGTARYWVPIVASLGCMFAALWVDSTVAALLLILAFGLLLDGATAMFEKAGSTGGMREYKQ
jgi:hypothetical protein